MRTPHNEPLVSGVSETASGRGHKASTPERRCVLSGEVAQKDALIRLAISPEGDVLPDPLARAPGRGAWIGVTRAELVAAMTGGGKSGKNGGKLRGALARAFKGASLNVPDNLPDLLESALTRLLLDRLGLEMRAGKLILGADRIAEQARSGRVALLLHASDASEDGRKKLDQAWRVGCDAEGSGKRGVTLPLDRATLSVALGRDNVVHMALADDRSAERIDTVLARLMRFLRAENTLTDSGAAHDARCRNDSGSPAGTGNLSFEG